MALSKYEQETIINYNSEDKTASVYTYDKKLVSKFRVFASKNAEITVISEGEDFGEYLIPKKWIKVRFPRELSAEQRAKLANNLKNAKENANA